MRIRPFTVSFLLVLASPAFTQSQEGGGPARPMPVSPGPRVGTLSEGATGNPAPRLFHAAPFRSARRKPIVIQPALERCSTQPDEHAWRYRDLLREMQSLSRRGLIPVVPVPGDAASLQDVSEFPSGWKAYGFVVPARGELEVKLDHVNQGWFRLIMVNKWGFAQEGMLQNMIPKGYPVVSFKNPKDTPQEIFVIADDPGWMSSKARPYTLSIHRSWDPKKVDVKPIPESVGIWAKQGTVSPAGAPATAPDPTLP